MKNLVKLLILLGAFLSSKLYAQSYKIGNKDGSSASPITIESFKTKGVNQGLEVKFTSGVLNIENKNWVSNTGQVFDTVSMKGLLDTKIKGSPELPYSSFIVTGHPSSIKVDIDLGDPLVIKNIRPRPVQEMPCRCTNVSDYEEKFMMDFKTYNKSHKKAYSLKYLGEYRGIPLTKVNVYPVQFEKSRGVVTYPEFKLNLVGKSLNLLSKNDIKPNFKKLAIFTGEKYLPTLEKFVDWKRAQGLEVMLYTRSDLGQTFEEIQKSIKGVYKRTRFNYAIIVGNEDSFPTDFVKTSSSYETPSDMSYFLFGGKDDRIPDAHFGRFVIENTSQLENQIKKIIEYESAELHSRTGFKKIVGVASNEGDSPSDREYVQEMAGHFVSAFDFDYKELYQDSEESTPETLVNHFSSGMSWLNYIGHGSGYSWPSMYESFDTDHIFNISVNSVKPVVIDVACQNGRFSLDNRLGVGLMNASSISGPTGAVAYYGGTVDISWHPPAIMAIGINKAVGEKITTTLGDSILAGQLYLLENYEDEEAALENFAWYQLQGDPTLKLNFIQ